MKKNWKKILYRTVMVVLASVFAYCCYYLINYQIGSQKNQESYDHLAQLVEDRPLLPPPSVNESTEPVETEPDEILVTVRNPETGETRKVLPEFAHLYTLNPDLVGWISIDGTKVNYPVVQSGTDNANYYLKHNFEKKYSVHGCIYAAETTDVFTPSDNVILYGHRMGDNSMFGQLGLYTDKAFWETHQYILFDTLEERHLYQVIAVFATSVSYGRGFAYHRFVDAADPEEFESFVQQCKALSYYDTGLTAEYGDKLLTLSTCEYTNTNGRLVVIAKQIA